MIRMITRKILFSIFSNYFIYICKCLRANYEITLSNKIMKKIIIIIFILFSPRLFSYDLFHGYGINLGLNTMKLLGSLSSVELQLSHCDNVLLYPGGGLRYVNPGIDLSAIFFIDSMLQHRLILGTEYIFLGVREIAADNETPLLHRFGHHNVQAFDIYAGYHYAFSQISFRYAKVFVGAEVMFNNILKNEYKFGNKHLFSSEQNIYSITSKPSESRLGARIRAGFEGKLYQNLYINASFTIGGYNILLRNNSNGELFNSKNQFETKESIQPFFNYLLALQYRF